MTCYPYLDDALAGSQRQSHQTCVVDGHNLVPDAEFAGASRWAAVQHAGEDDGGQDGPPAGLHDHHAEALAFLLLHVQLEHTSTGSIQIIRAHSKSWSKKK